MSSSNRPPVVAGYTLQQAQRDIAALRGQIQHLNSYPLKANTSGFPTGWSGSFSYQKMPLADLVFLDWGFTIANGTVVTTNEAITTLPSGYYNPSDNTLLPGNILGASGNAYGPFGLGTSGSVAWNGAGFTVSGTYFAYGQAVIIV